VLLQAAWDLHSFYAIVTFSALYDVGDRKGI